jgi:outer membrane protein
LTGNSPGSLTMPDPLSKPLPSSIEKAYAIAEAGHPAVLARDSLVNSGLFSVKAAEGAFLPQVSLSAGVSNTYSNRGGGPTRDDSSQSERAEIGARITVPIYQGGQASATVRQRKEELGQARIEKDVARDQVRAAVTTSWTQLVASRAALAANGETVRAQRLALDGVVEERNVGQRTTLDVLNAQANLINAQISLIQARRDLVVSSYALASAVGRLSAKRLGLHVKHYDAEEHYNLVKDAWYGLRTPDGR